MADVHALLEQYIAEHRSGGRADAREWLDRVEGADRAKLTALIDAYLERAPMRDWDPEAFRESGLAAFAEQVNASLYSPAGTWPAVLPALRDKAKLRREDLVARLAAALGAQDKEPKVGSYYHQMEKGLLAQEGVNQKVLDALGSIVGQSADALRRAGQSLAGGAVSSEAPAAFARTTGVDLSGAPAEAAGAPPAPEAEWDEVDRLFRGG